MRMSSKLKLTLEFVRRFLSKLLLKSTNDKCHSFELEIGILHSCSFYKKWLLLIIEIR